ncbi:MAG: Holliday junction resolvase RuvX [Gammaproteobacteria bacterium]|nr:Holliday junction resolvase RuvX [Gammaproteobacteria bacterium]
MPENPVINSLLGFDFGLKRIGVASGQTFTNTASPVAIVDAKDGEPDWLALDKLVREWRPHGLVVGLPLFPDGSPGDMTEPAKRFAKALELRFQLPVFLQNEALSSREADSLMQHQRATGIRNRKVRKGDNDRVAASLILQRWLAQQQNLKSS